MATIAPFSLFAGTIVPTEEARLSVASSAVLYGLSVYSVFYGKVTDQGKVLAFRLPDHLTRLRDSAKMIGFTGIDEILDPPSLISQLRTLVAKNNITTDHFFRITIHATEPIPGVRTANIALTLSVFMYEAVPILPSTGARLKTSLWRRTADVAIPARAKVNGAYVNSALARQDALDAGYDDALFLNNQEYVSELSAANIFMVKSKTLYTPDCASDILEGITRRSIICLAEENGLKVIERKLALTEFYTADEVFACGTSAFVAPIISIDSRQIGNGTLGPVTELLRNCMTSAYADPASHWTTAL